MPLSTISTQNFQVQYDPSQYTAAEVPQVQSRAQAIAAACEPDLATLSGWFGVADGAGFGGANQIQVILDKSVRGGVNFGYGQPPVMRITPALGQSDDYDLGIFIAELSEILMSYTGKWGASNSGGEGLSRVSAEMLHPQYAPAGEDNYVNAWLAADPTADPSSAYADSEFRKDWVSANFTGGPLRAGGQVGGDDDSYSYGCSMLFLNWLHNQQGYSMAQIVQNGGASLEETYSRLTQGRADAFWTFEALVNANFPGANSKAKSDNPFPLPTETKQTNLAPGAGAAGDCTAVVATDALGRVFYDFWLLGQGGKGFREMTQGWRTDAAPSIALVGNYLFAAMKGLGAGGNLFLNQGVLGTPLVGWNEMDFQTNVAPALASLGNTTAIVAVDQTGRILYDRWKLGQGGTGFQELTAGGQTDAAPAAALVDPQNPYLFTLVKGLDGYLYLNQGHLGGAMVGWNQLDFQSKFAPGAASSGDTTAIVAVDQEGRIFYDYWQLGQGGTGLRELDGDGRTDAAPTAALVGAQHDYLFVVIKGLDGNLYLNQGELGKASTGWEQM